MDFLVLAISAISLINFLVIKIVILRYIGSGKIIQGLVYAFGIATLIHFLIFFFLFGFILAFISFIIFWISSIIYVWAIVGIATTSLRIQLLVTISEAKNGISYTKLLEKYNKNIIIENRLKRLTEAREITYINGKYHYNQKISYFRIHMFLLLLLAKLYKVTSYRL